MKKLVSLAMLYIFLFGLIIFEGCIYCGLSDETETIYYSFSDLRVNLTGTGYGYEHDSLSEIPRQRIAIAIRPDTLEITEVKVSKKEDGYGSRLYACSPEAEEVYNQLIADVNVFALQAQGDSIQVGDDITSDFYAHNGFDGLYSGISYYLSKLTQPKLMLVYQNVPAIDSISFAVRTRLSDGQILYDTTRLVKLN